MRHVASVSVLLIALALATSAAASTPRYASANNTQVEAESITGVGSLHLRISVASCQGRGAPQFRAGAPLYHLWRCHLATDKGELDYNVALTRDDTRCHSRVHYCSWWTQVAPQTVDPLKAWSPKVEAFYQDTLAAINALGQAAAGSGDLQSALTQVGQCEAHLAADTGATPNVTAALNAMTQLHQGCSLLATAANEVSSRNPTLITASTTDLGAGLSLIRSVLTSLGQPV